MTQRNFALDFLKLILACCVVVLHFNWKVIPRGYLSVEFFFMISGFLIYRGGRFLNYKPLNAFKKIYPIYIASIITILAFSDESYSLLTKFLSFFMLQSLGLNDEIINVPSWFLCVYLFSIPIICFILKKVKDIKNGTIYFCSFTPVIIYLIIYISTPSTGFNYSYEIQPLGITVGIWRCFAATLLGVLASIASKNIKIKKSLFTSIIEILLLSYFVFLFCFSGWNPTLDYLSLPAIMLAVLLTAERAGCVSKAMDNAGRKLKIPGTLSTYIFLFHFPIIMIINEIEENSYVKLYMTLAFIAVSVGIIINTNNPNRKIAS